jgi:hypothetical protein
MKKYKNSDDSLNNNDEYPYLTYDHPLAMKLLLMQINRYNKRAEKWGYKTRFEYNMQCHTGMPNPFIDPKIDVNAGFWRNFINGYRNEYLDSLGCIMMNVSLRLKRPLLKRYWKFVSFWLNYP